MDKLIQAIHKTPIIDNHAHPILKPEAQSKYPLLSITTEAHGDALTATISSLSHLRAVKQLTQVLECKESWEDVVRAIGVEKAKPGDVWNKRCFEGIETVLIDDGLDSPQDVFEYAWHDRLTTSRCKRIVRIEKVTEQIVSKHRRGPKLQPNDQFPAFVRDFETSIQTSISDTEVVGFKSVICYRTGLNIPSEIDDHETTKTKSKIASAYLDHFSKRWSESQAVERIHGTILNAYLVHKTAQLIRDSESKHKKPFQFHTGLGDNDITLTSSSPSHMQDFIRAYPTVPIVLLHASYPWTKEAGYLASVYANVYADIGEVFPMVSREGQENVVREILELCPTAKVLWSTDGHWFPETYLLAKIQIREALERVIPGYVSSGDLSIDQAEVAVQDILFNTSNQLYDLQIPLAGLELSSNILHRELLTLKSTNGEQSHLRNFKSFLRTHPDIKYLRLQYLDYTATLRARVFPVSRVLKLLQTNGRMSASITKASLGLLQNDCVFPNAGTIATSGEYQLEADFSSMRAGPFSGFASVATEFKEQAFSELDLCPRTVCRRAVQKAETCDLELLVGFEIEIVFLEYDQLQEKHILSPRLGRGHSWGSSQALNNPLALQLLDEVFEALALAGIDLEYFHPESAQGQYEFILPPLPPVEAVDTLIQARQIIIAIAASQNLRATLIPKPFPRQAGPAAHFHISLTPPASGIEDSPFVQRYQSFYAGILNHLPAILAFNYSQQASYERMIEGSHWEVKVLDGLANVYFVIAAIISAVTQGVVENERLAIQDCQLDPGTLNETDRKKLGIRRKLPKCLESLRELDEDKVLKKLLGEAFVERYLKVKEAEMKLLSDMKEEERREWIIERY